MIRECCCTPHSECDAFRPCIGGECGDPPFVIPGYPSIGWPDGPTKFDGPLWVAWHNGVTSRRASMDIMLKLTAYRRRFVQSGDECDATEPTPSVADDCTDSGIVLEGKCAGTEYIQSWQYQIAGKLRYVGGNAQQSPCISEGPAGEKWASAPEGPWPFALADCTRSLIGGNDIVATDTDPAWWPGENRRIVPVFANQMTVYATPDVSNDFPQDNSDSGTVVVVNQCGESQDEYSEPVCVFAPIVVVPGHQTVVDAADEARCGTAGACVCGTPSSPYSCGVDNLENGAEEAAWGLDIKEARLASGLAALGLNSSNYIGELAKVWMTCTDSGNLRLLFGARSRMSAGGVLGFPDAQMKAEAWTVSRAAPGESLVIAVELEFTPSNWCLADNDACDCAISHPENAPAAVDIQFHAVAGGCGCGAPVALGGYTLAVGNYEVPICAFPAICNGGTPDCMQYPVTAACAGFHPTIRVDFVGAAPVERAHAGWRYYRNRYDHFMCVNDLSGLGGCCVGAVDLGSAGITELCGSSCTAVDPTYAASHGPCPGDDAQCQPSAPAITVPAGCHPVTYAGGQQRIAVNPDGGACQGCADQWFRCGPAYFRGDCGYATYNACDCCNTQYIIALPEVLIVDWNFREACSVIGTWPLYSASVATMCDRSAWQLLGYAVVT